MKGRNKNMIVTLEALKELVSANTNIKPIIKKVYIDYGSNWIDNNLVAPATEYGLSYQIVSPMDIQKINKNLYTIEDAQQLIDEINKKNNK